MPKFKNTADLMRYIRSSVDDALNNEVFEEVKKTERVAVQEDVYDAHPEGRYKRREDHGGLADPDNVIKVGPAKNGVLIVENITLPNPYLNGVNPNGGLSTTPAGFTIAELIIKGIYDPVGYGYDYWRGAFPRDYIQGTIDRLKVSGGCTAALKNGLIRHGMTVR